jgi:energy-coupling factor transporter ATP-binding protein EcfA2
MLTPAALLLMRLLGPALTRALITRLLRDAITGSDMAETLTDSLNIPGLVAQWGGDYRAQKDAERFFERIGEDAAAGVARVFESESETVAPAVQEQVAQAAAKLMESHALPLLLQSNLDEPAFRRQLEATPPPAWLHQQEHTLYRRVLGECSRTIFAIAARLPDFDRDTIAALLQRTDRLQQDVQQALAELARLHDVSWGATQQRAGAEFERDYRRLLAERLDRLKLFGMPPSIANYDQPLSVAYVTLQVRWLSRQPQAGAPLSEAESDAPFTGERSPGAEKVVTPLALAQADRWLITGPAGSGKTTLLKWIGVRAARQDFEEVELSHWRDKVPFFVRLRDFAQESLPSFGRLPVQKSAVPELAGSLPPGWAEEQLKAGRVILLLDGLDEVSQRKLDEALEWLQSLETLAPATVLVVSTRPDTLPKEGVEARLRRLNLQQMIVQDMDDEAIETFMGRWHDALAHERSLLSAPEKEKLAHLPHALQKSLQHQPAIRQLMRNPLLCAMVCALNQAREGNLAQGRGRLDRIELYRDCLVALLERRESDRGVDSSDFGVHLTLREKERRLATLAYWMMDNGVSAAGPEEAAQQLGGGEEGAAFRRWLTARSGLLQEVNDQAVEFVHRTFQEYLAAQDIVYRNNIRAVCRRAAEANWHETIRLTGGVSNTEAGQQTFLEELARLAAKESDEKRRQ